MMILRLRQFLHKVLSFNKLCHSALLANNVQKITQSRGKNQRQSSIGSKDLSNNIAKLSGDILCGLFGKRM